MYAGIAETWYASNAAHEMTMISTIGEAMDGLSWEVRSSAEADMAEEEASAEEVSVEATSAAEGQEANSDTFHFQLPLYPNCKIKD